MIWLFYILGAFWSLACIVGLFWLLGIAWEEGGLAGFVITGFTLPIGLALTVLPWTIIEQETGPDLTTLKKGEWVCTAKHTTTSTTYVQSGNVMVPMVSEIDVCDQYTRVANTG